MALSFLMSSLKVLAPNMKAGDEAPKPGSRSRSTSAGSASSPECNVCDGTRFRFPEYEYPAPLAIEKALSENPVPRPAVERLLLLGDEEDKARSCPASFFSAPPGLEHLESKETEGAAPLFMEGSFCGFLAERKIHSASSSGIGMPPGLSLDDDEGLSATTGSPFSSSVYEESDDHMDQVKECEISLDNIGFPPGLPFDESCPVVALYPEDPKPTAPTRLSELRARGSTLLHLTTADAPAMYAAPVEPYGAWGMVPPLPFEPPAWSPLFTTQSMSCMPPPPPEWFPLLEQDYQSMMPPPPAEWAPVVQMDAVPPPPLTQAEDFSCAEPVVPSAPPAVPENLPVPSPQKLAEAEELKFAHTEEALLLPELGSPELPTMGSAGHSLGVCKPCAFVHTKGCSSGTACPFCHLCAPGEKKRRKKQQRHEENSLMASQ